MKKKFFLGIDTETTGSIGRPLVYDAGLEVFDLSGEVYERQSLVIYDVYVGMKDLMASAYYADKLPQYEIDLKNGTRQMVKFSTLKDRVYRLIKKYDIEAVCAYNTNFDRKALDNTLRVLTNYEKRFFFPYGTKYIDIWNMACSTIFQTSKFYEMAYDNDWFSECGNVKTNAETAYKFITKKIDFEESHTALEDVDIEKEVMLTCWRKSKDVDRVIIGNPWRKPQKTWYYYEAHRDGII